MLDFVKYTTNKNNKKAIVNKNPKIVKLLNVKHRYSSLLLAALSLWAFSHINPMFQPT